MAVVSGLSLIGLLGFYLITRPKPHPQTEIYQGVWLQVRPSLEGLVMVVEVDLNQATLRLNAPDASGQFRLLPSDWQLWRSDAEVMLNGVLYTPAEAHVNLPLMAVQAYDWWRVDGQSTGSLERYALWQNAAGQWQVARNKPVSETVAKQAKAAVGLQGLLVIEGRLNEPGIRHDAPLMARSFIGLSQDQQTLYLIAGDALTEDELAHIALKAGAANGGQLDGDDALHLLIGRHAKGIFPHYGFHHWRPLGPVLLIDAQRLDAH